MAPLLLTCLHEGRESLSDYLGRDGYRQLTNLSGDAILSMVAEAGLRGRGGTGLGLPAAAKWREVRSGRSGDRYLLANGAETSPGSLKDRYLLERFPHRVLEGAVAAARAVGAQKVYLYIKATAAEAIASVEQALTELQEAGLPELALPEFELVRAPETGVAGEESAACDAIEGFEGRPQVKPPTPAISGILGRPTLVTNVETLAATAAIVRDGVAQFRAVGLPHAPGTALFTLTGDVRQPGVYELPLGTPLQRLIDQCGGGATGPVVAVLPGGFRSGPLGPDELQIPLDYDAIAEAGSNLGPAHVIVLAEPANLAELMLGALDLAALGSCKQCSICGEGIHRMREAAAQIAAGAEPAALRAEMMDWATVLHGKGNCLLPTGVAAMVRRAVERFDSWKGGE